MSSKARIYLDKNITVEEVVKEINKYSEYKANLEKKDSSFKIVVETISGFRIIWGSYYDEPVEGTKYDGREYYLYLSMGADAQAEVMLKRVVRKFGGYIDINDGLKEEPVYVTAEKDITEEFKDKLRNLCDEMGYSYDVLKYIDLDKPKATVSKVSAFN